MNLPPVFISNIQNTYREDGYAFLKALPDLILEASTRWDLTDVEPAPTLSYNFVAFARRGHEQVVLKMGVPNNEMKSEINALRFFNGEGACRLLDCDEEKCWMLLERLQPGVMLSTLEDDEEATNIAASVMQKIWTPLESGSSLAPCDLRRTRAGVLPNDQQQAVGLQRFIQLSDWFDGLKELRLKFDGGTGPLNEKLVERVEGSVKEFLAENHRPVLMHGDFHHYNILSSERGWLVIDPKGVVGPACYEVGPFLNNPWAEFLSERDYPGITKRRIDILHECLGFERKRIHEWGLAYAILSAWWSLKDNTGWESAATFAEIIADLDIK